MGYKWVVMNVSMTRGHVFEGKCLFYVGIESPLWYLKSPLPSPQDTLYSHYNLQVQLTFCFAHYLVTLQVACKLTLAWSWRQQLNFRKFYLAFAKVQDLIKLSYSKRWMFTTRIEGKENHERGEGKTSSTIGSSAFMEHVTLANFVRFWQLLEYMCTCCQTFTRVLKEKPSWSNYDIVSGWLLSVSGPYAITFRNHILVFEWCHVTRTAS